MSEATIPLPGGFSVHVGNIGIRDDTDDFVVVAAADAGPAAAVFTRSRFSGPSVELSRRHVADGSLRGIVVISKNANVANGIDGAAHASEVCERVADRLGCAADQLLIASTGVIGRLYPMDAVRAYLDALPADFVAAAGEGTDAMAVATAMMTTDTVPKVAVAQAGEASVVGVAKGVGMIEPDMATMLAFVFTDAEVPAAELSTLWTRVVDRTFNCLSVDTDTSTSDTAAILANGTAGPVPPSDLEMALNIVCLSLTRQLASDAEGAETLIVVEVTGARDAEQAKRVAKSIVNSPLVKTAVHGADPNWGRIAMAVGKVDDDDIDQGAVRIAFADQEVYPTRVDEAGLADLEAYMAGDEVLIQVDLGIAAGTARVYGCDLTDGYVRINADYTT